MKYPLLPASLVSFLTSAVFGGEPLVTLSANERAGVARPFETVLFGVPLPPGKVRSGEELALYQGSERIPAEIIPLTHHLQDKSVKWIHVLFSTSCKAHGTRLFTLVHQRAKPPKRSIEIREHADRYDVATALVNFSVRKTGFSVIENVRRKGRLLVPPHDKGLFVRVGTELYQARLDPGVTVTIQEQGPLHAVFRAEGSFRNASGKRCFDFVCFLACFAQSPVVRLSLTLLNRQGKYDEGLPLSGFFLQLPTTLSEGTVIVAGSEGAKKARLAAQNEAFLYQKDSERGFFGGGNTCAAMSYLYRHTKDTRYLQSALRQLPTRSRFSNPWKDFALTMRNAALCAGDLHHVALKEQERKKR